MGPPYPGKKKNRLPPPPTEQNLGQRDFQILGTPPPPPPYRKIVDPPLGLSSELSFI